MARWLYRAAYAPPQCGPSHPADLVWTGDERGFVRLGENTHLELGLRLEAHGQDIYDANGDAREVHDRIRNICEIGVRTLRWSFINRDRTPPPAPAVRLQLPSGDWAEWPGDGNGSIEGPAEDFALVVTQRRPFEETRLAIVGDDAQEWMRIAQCFAGAPQERAAPGTRPPIATAVQQGRFA